MQKHSSGHVPEKGWSPYRATIETCFTLTIRLTTHRCRNAWPHVRGGCLPAGSHNLHQADTSWPGPAPQRMAKSAPP
jgi:hypothetical protein